MIRTAQPAEATKCDKEKINKSMSKSAEKDYTSMIRVKTEK